MVPIVSRLSVKRLMTKEIQPDRAVSMWINVYNVIDEAMRHMYTRLNIHITYLN